MIMPEPITEIEKLSRISDEIMQLGSNCTTKFNVSLKKMINDQPYFFYNEFEYNGKYKEPSVSVKKNFDYYISIENYKRQDAYDKAFIRIGVREFPLFKRALNTCIAWFTDKKFAKLFIKVGKNISMSSPIPHHTMDNLPMDKWLRFEPVVHENYEGAQEPAVRMYLSSELNYTDITVDTLIGFTDMLSNMNMFQIAESMIPKITIPLGTHRIRLDQTEYSYNRPVTTSLDIGGVSGRQPSGKKKGIDDLGT